MYDRGRAGRRDALIFFGLILLPLLLVGAVRLPLFQDGSSYLLEVMVSHSAVRHHRYPALLVQMPAIVGLRFAHAAHLSPESTLRAVSLLFNMSYALVPALSLLLSWAVVWKRNPTLILWAATPILLFNLINFSGVSELLIGMQLSCPLMLAVYQRRLTLIDTAIIVTLLPIIFLLHPLVSVLFGGIAAASLVRAALCADARRQAILLACLFAVASALRLVMDAFSFTDYERGMLEKSELGDYFSITLENALFLAVAAGATIAVAFAKQRRSINRLVLPCIAVMVLAIFLSVQNGLSAVETRFGHQPPLSVLSTLIPLAAGALAVFFWMKNDERGGARMVLLSLWAAAFGVVSQFVVYQWYPLKTGATVMVAAAMCLVAGYDSSREHGPEDRRLRRLFLLHAAAVFAAVLTIKALIWHASTVRLNRSLSEIAAPCIEVDNPAMAWVYHPPYTILNNWSLASLALVTPRQREPGLVLATGGCRTFAQTGLVPIDPWSSVDQRYLPFAFDAVRK